MKDNKEIKISYWSSHITTIVTVSLVLLIVGIMALLSVVAQRETTHLTESVELSVILGDTVTDARGQQLAEQIARQPYASNVQLHTRAQAQEEFKRDAGIDMDELYGAEFLSPEIEVQLKSQYTSPDSIKSVTAQLSALPDVEETTQPDVEMVHNMNHGLRKVVWVLGGIALAMLLISFVLINNTVRLATYSRRFTIHTMQLVGATDGYIRAPFVRGNAISGAIAGVVASVVLVSVLLGVEASGIIPFRSMIGWGTFGIVAAGLVAIGAGVCAGAALLATRRYLHADYDELFR